MTVRVNLFKKFFAKDAWIKSVFTVPEKIEIANTVLARLGEKEIVELYREIVYRTSVGLH